MGHSHSSVQVLLALGNDPGSNFNITLMPVFTENGLGEFCMREVMVPSSVEVMDGMNATIQVVTSGDPSGGLYNVYPSQPIYLPSNESILAYAL